MMKPITYLSDTPTDYSNDIAACGSHEELLATLQSYRSIANDAFLAAPTKDEFPQFVVGLKKERKGKFAGEEFASRFGAVLMPELMLKVTLYANHFGVPFGATYLRMKDLGHIVCDDSGIESVVDNRLQP